MKLLPILLIFMLSFINCTKPDASAQTGKVTDIDGNVYATQVIGDQTWMMDNLMNSHYNDGTIIMNGNVSNSGMYTFCQVATGKLCPLNWHVPADWEWHVLLNYTTNMEYVDIDLGYWWSSSTLVEGYDSEQAWGWFINQSSSQLRNFVVLKEQYLSVRCIKNQ